MKIIKIYNTRVTKVVFEVEYFWNGWVTKVGVYANLVSCDWPNFRYPIDFAFSPGLIKKFEIDLKHHSINKMPKMVDKALKKNQN